MYEMHYFHLLKDYLLRKFCEANPYWQLSLSDFGVREIARFQELLQETTGGRISEKWFYTHLKPRTNEKLPRIDVLDLLSEFAGFNDWAGFVTAHKEETPVAILAPPVNSTQEKWKLPTPVIIFSGLMAIALLALTMSRLWVSQKRTFKTCFVDALTRQPLTGTEIELQVLKKGETPSVEKAQTDGCYTLRTQENQISFKVKAAYYIPDTITRSLTEDFQEEIFSLHADDYALMIHLFSTGKVQDWKKRRQQLDQMIAPNAMIFQISGETGMGMELYNKEEFISKLTLPVSGLKNLRILETEYDKAKGQIKVLRFVQEQ